MLRVTGETVEQAVEKLLKKRNAGIVLDDDLVWELGFYDADGIQRSARITDEFVGQMLKSGSDTCDSLWKYAMFGLDF